MVHSDVVEGSRSDMGKKHAGVIRRGQGEKRKINPLILLSHILCRGQMMQRSDKSSEEKQLFQQMSPYIFSLCASSKITEKLLKSKLQGKHNILFLIFSIFLY